MFHYFLACMKDGRGKNVPNQIERAMKMQKAWCSTLSLAQTPTSGSTNPSRSGSPTPLDFDTPKSKIDGAKMKKVSKSGSMMHLPATNIEAPKTKSSTTKMAEEKRDLKTGSLMHLPTSNKNEGII